MNNMYTMKKIAIIIPAYNPDSKFLELLCNLSREGYKDIIVINDGSRNGTESLFNTAEKIYNCIVLNHSINLGQGRSYKTGFNYYLQRYSASSDKADNDIGIIQCDCDGQHTIADINKCAELLYNNPDKFILGVREFSSQVPIRSRVGNNITAFIFKTLCNLDLKDTQTGLKGIPKALIPTLMEVPGERFEYASSVLLAVKRQGVEILQFPIETVYIEGNKTSHFRPLIDSLRIYSLILKYLAASISAFVVDITAFTAFIWLTKGLLPRGYIIISTYLSKIISCTYSFFVNKNVVFNSSAVSSSAFSSSSSSSSSKEERGLRGLREVRTTLGKEQNLLQTGLKFALVCIMQSSLSGFITDWFVRFFNWKEVMSKILVDTALFFISYQTLRRWVFKQAQSTHQVMSQTCQQESAGRNQNANSH